jgi:succinyl-diaminopimelate desuccinylase
VAQDLKALLARIDDGREEIVRLTSRLLAVESVRPEPPGGEDPIGAGCRECLELAADLCRQRGMEVRMHEDQVVVAEMGAGAENVAFAIHVDTVPAGDGWTHPPFGGVVAEGEVWGRGAQDDKGPLASVLGALDAITELGLPLRRRVTLVIGSDEETGVWRDLNAFHAAEPMPTMTIVPDGDFPIISAEKGFANIIVDTPPVRGEGDCRLLELSAGTRVNIVPDEAVALVSGLSEAYLTARAAAFMASHPRSRLTIEPVGDALKMTAQGTPTHASTPEKGHSALLDLAEFLAPEPFAASAPERALRFVDQLLGQDLHGERLGTYAHDSKMGHCTCTAGKVEATEPGSVRVWLNLRPVRGQTIDSVRKAIEGSVAELAARTGGEYSVAAHDTCREPLYVPEDSELVRGLQRAYQDVTGEPATCESIGGTTFAKAFENAVVFGPVADGDPPLAHERDERVTIEALVRNAKLYGAAIWHLAGEQSGTG